MRKRGVTSVHEAELDNPPPGFTPDPYNPPPRDPIPPVIHLRY